MKLPTIVLTILGISVAHAFPPAPSYTLYGLVRDQVGQVLDVDGASLILLKGTEEVGRAPINSKLGIDQNYSLKIRIDTGRPESRAYSENAITANGAFSLAVEMNGARFYPIEINGTLTAGNGGETQRLDLNLGEDSDADGLPDVWEQWQLFQAGELPGDDGWDLSLIDRDGDFDKDGDSNHTEYIAGTFAGDNTETFSWELTDIAAERVSFEIFAITGKRYTLEKSTDSVNWQRVRFSVGEDGQIEDSYEAKSVGIIPAYYQAPRAGRSFYRLSVR